jgi:predicted metal-binding membrane protein
MTGAERIAARSRAVTVGGLAVLVLLAWAFLLGGGGMGGSGMATMAMEPPGFAIILAMWWVMMIAMMVPSAAPAILLYARVHRDRIDSSSPPPTAAFLLGYLACWLGFSGLAATAQTSLARAAIASPATMAIDSPIAAGLLLAAAGLYQLTPLKNACLGRCRSPAEFLVRHYRPAVAGAFRLGAIHGAYCVGCCWLLMALLFVGGVMNLAWIAALTLLVAAEKLLPKGEWIARVAGVAMILAGMALVAL